MVKGFMEESFIWKAAHNCTDAFGCQKAGQGPLCYFCLQTVAAFVAVGTSWQLCPPPSLQNKHLLWPDCVSSTGTNIIRRVLKWIQDNAVPSRHCIYSFICLLFSDRAEEMTKHQLNRFNNGRLNFLFFFSDPKLMLKFLKFGPGVLVSLQPLKTRFNPWCSAIKWNFYEGSDAVGVYSLWFTQENEWIFNLRDPE